MQLGHVRRQVCVALVGADDEAAGFRDCEIGACHARVGREDQRTIRVALRLRQIMDVAVVGVGADRLGEHLSHIGPELVHRWDHDMARIFVVELLYALAEVGFDHLDADRRHIGAKTALLGQHRLALDEGLGAVIPEDCVDDAVLLGGVASPMHIGAVRTRIGLELFEVLVQVRERVLLDRKGEEPKFLPFGNAVHLAVTLLPQIP